MPLLVDKLKLKAAARSINQFCPHIRAIFPDHTVTVSDAVVEAATIYFYVRMAREVFGKRFASMLDRSLRKTAKHASPADIDACAARIRSETIRFERTVRANPTGGPLHKEFEEYVRSIITALLREANAESGTNLAMDTGLHARFDSAVRRIKSHLQGIKSQNHFIMK